METIYLLLGSNQGDSLKLLQEAIGNIRKLGSVSKTSSVYRTKPWGKTDQPDFLNQALELKSTQSPEELLLNLKRIELSLGKSIPEKWGPRTIDIDILFYGNTIIDSPTLIIPHPRIQDRRFVLRPLSEIVPGLIHPTINKSILELLNACMDDLGVIKLD